MNPKEESSSSIRASSRLSFTIFAVMSVVMLALAAGAFIDGGKVVLSGILTLGGIGAMIACFATRPKK